MNAPAPLTLLGKPECHLCQEMREALRRVAPRLAVIERDIRADPDLERRYLWEIPVLLLGEVEVAKLKVSDGDLARRLERLGAL